MDRRVTIVEPNASWSTEFEAIATTLREALGPLALRIDHIGSTSVSGLPAKDIIDIQITVASLDRDRLVPALARAGFVDQAIGNDHRPPGATGPDDDWRKLFFQPRIGRPANVHVRVQAGPTGATRCSPAATCAPIPTPRPHTPRSSEGWRPSDWTVACTRT